MATLTLLPNATWFKPSVSTVTKSSITTINIVDAYSLSSSETVTDSWDASEDTDGSIMVYVQDGTLIIAGNGSGKIYANADSSKVFDGFSAVTIINGANLLNMSNATTLLALFQGCKALTSVDVSTWDVSNVGDMKGVFNKCNSLQSIDVSNWNISSATSIRGMFQSCSSLTSVDVSKWVTDNVTEMKNMFFQCSALTSLDVSNWNTSSVTNMELMFNRCSSLTSLDVSNWNTSNVTNMRCLFQSCSSLTSLDVSNWNTSNVTNMSWLFYGCSSLTSLDVSNWNTGKVTTMGHIFTNCDKLSDFDVSNWNMKNVISVDGFFHSTKKKVYNISKWNTSNCHNFSQLFENCSNTEEIIGLDQIDTSNGKRFAEMFNGCSKLVSLDLSNFDMRSIDDSWSDPDMQDSGVNATIDMLKDLTSLKVLKLGQYCNLRDNSGLSDPSPDNYWYAESTGIRYKSANILQGVAETYLADSPEVLIKSSSLYKIADAIREATGGSNTIKVSEMGNFIQGNIVTTLNEISAGITDFEFTSTPESIDPQFFAKCTNLKNIYCTWEENAIEGAPWGAPDTATIWYEGGQPDFES